MFDVKFEKESEIHRLEREKEDALQHCALCQSDLDSRDIAVRELEKALADVRLPDSASDGSTADKLSKKSSTKRGRSSKAKEKQSKDPATLEHAAHRAAKLARKLTDSTLDGANWQQKARELANQLDALREEKGLPPTPDRFEHAARSQKSGSPSSDPA